jgi:hypothetical protein
MAALARGARGRDVKEGNASNAPVPIPHAPPATRCPSSPRASMVMQGLLGIQKRVLSNVMSYEDLAMCSRPYATPCGT